jgi:hypothetical protein
MALNIDIREALLYLEGQKRACKEAREGKEKSPQYTPGSISA